MYVTVLHRINDSASFHTRGQALSAQASRGVTPLQFFPEANGRRAVCLWQAKTVDDVREYIDGTLGDSSEQEYFAVAESYAVGLPTTQRA